MSAYLFALAFFVKCHSLTPLMFTFVKHVHLYLFELGFFNHPTDENSGWMTLRNILNMYLINIYYIFIRVNEIIALQIYIQSK